MSKRNARPSTLLIPILIALVALAAAPGSVQAEIASISWLGDVYSIDETNGTGFKLGPSGFSGTNALARDGSGTLYSMDWIPRSSFSRLVKLDPTTGAGTVVALVNGLDFRALAFSPDGVLYGRTFGGPLDSQLVTVDVVSGMVTPRGLTHTGIQSLAFSPDGTLYGWAVGLLGLVTIDTSNGAVTDVFPTIGTVKDIQALTFAPDGTLYAARDSLYTIDLVTGALTLIGRGGYEDLRGIEFLAAVPEPDTLLLFIVGSLGMFSLRWIRGGDLRPEAISSRQPRHTSDAHIARHDPA